MFDHPLPSKHTVADHAAAQVSCDRAEDLPRSSALLPAVLQLRVSVVLNTTGWLDDPASEGIPD